MHSISKFRRSARGAAELSQFPLVMYVLFIVILFPILNLGNLLVAAATQYLATNDIAAKAATQSDFASALNAMTNSAYQFQTTGLAKFVHLSPNGGYVGCGDDLYVVMTQLGSGITTVSPANQGLVPQVNVVQDMYEYQVKSAYTVSPLISLESVPFLGSVPGLGQPVTLAFTANRPVEHPSGLLSGNAGTAGGGTASGLTPFPRVSSNPGSANPPTPSTWRTPNIYELIQQQGLSVISSNVVIVPANDSSLTPTGLLVQPGDKIWIDTQAVGIWNLWPGTTVTTDANGYPNTSTLFPWYPWYYYMPTSPMGSLLGQLSASAAPFYLGNDQYNLPPPSTGNLGLICNDYAGVKDAYGDNTGSQMVRVIIVH